jgi:hypothetical protein
VLTFSVSYRAIMNKEGAIRRGLSTAETAVQRKYIKEFYEKYTSYIRDNLKHPDFKAAEV